MGSLFTPGVVFIAQSLTPVLSWFLFVQAARHAVLNYTDVPKDTVPGSGLLSLGFVVCLPLYLVLQAWIMRFRQSREAKRMGATPAPVLKGKWPGNLDLLIDMLRNWQHGYPGDGFWEWMEEAGHTFNLHPLGEDVLLTVDPENIKSILAHDFNNFEKGPKFRANLDSVLGNGIFNSDGEMWKLHRSMTRPFFTRDRRVEHFEMFDRHAGDLIHQLKARYNEHGGGVAVDMSDAFARFTLDSATEFLFGSCVASLSAGLPFPHTHAHLNATRPTTTTTPRARHAEDFASAFGESQHVVSARVRTGWTWPLLELFGDKTKGSMRVVNAYLGPLVKEAVEKHQEKKGMMERLYGAGASEDIKESAKEETLLDQLLDLTQDQKLLKDEIFNILMASRDTTAFTLTAVVYVLAMYPDVLARLRAEVLDKVGPSKMPSYDDVRDMKYLRAVINETLRLFPPVPFNVRDSINATTLRSKRPGEKPIYVPPRTSVSYSVFIMHRRQDLWGPDAEEFDPDRFIDERLGRYLTPNPFIFLPFNAGPRICPGQQFAYDEVSFMIIRLLQHFSTMELSPEAHESGTLPPDAWKACPGRKARERFFPKVYLTMFAHGGLWVKMKEATK